jgi:uncharacterized protein with HEPN domain
MKDVTADQFWDNGEKRDAVAMRISAIGEAARNLTRETEAALPTVPFGNIRGMRNRIAHEYGKVDFREVWNVTQQDIGNLVTVLGLYFAKKNRAIP